MHKGGWGGQPNRILVVSKELKNLGHQVTIVAPKGATLIERARKEKIDTFDGVRFPKRFNPLTFCREVLALSRVMNEKGIEVVHTHGSQDTWVATLTAKLFLARPVPVVRTRHNTFTVRNHVANRLLYRVLIDRVVVVSRAVTELFRKTGVLGAKVDRCVTIHSVVDSAERFNPRTVTKAGVRGELGIPRNAVILLKTARLAPEKGHIHALKVLEKLSGQVNQVHLLLAGEGPLLTELQEVAKRMGIEKQVHFLGLRPDVPNLLRESQLFIFTPTAGESLGTSALEALAMEVPVVAFWMGGIDASVKDGENGYLLPVGDTEGMVRQTLLLLTSPRGRKVMGKRGRRRMRLYFSPPSLAQANIGLYHEVLKEPARASKGAIG